MSGPARADFFVSYTQADRAWAEWIGWQLEQAGYTVILQAWDFLPGTDWVHQMHTAVQRAERTLAVLSPAYLGSSEFGEAEWRVAFAADPSGEGRRLIPVRVLECHPEGLLKTRVYVDLTGRGEQDAAAALLRGVSEHTGRPGSKPAFPSGRATVAADRPRFPGALPAAAPEVRYSLPQDTTAFTGRGEELNQITVTVADVAETGGVAAVRAIAGMPGVGKTALAVHAAHVLRDRFPDRQLYIDLHAHTPGREPVRPEDALAGLLTVFGIDRRFLPGDLDGRAAMWRDKMAGHRALLVLDNAASTSQVAPLLPGDRGCLVLVTSRRHLGDLPGTVTWVWLNVLPPSQAQEMFTRLARRAAGSPAEVAELVRLAGFLPLAISLLARMFARHPAWTLADLAAETRDSPLALTAERDSIPAAFDVSYRHLATDQRRFFCRLGLHPGTTTIDAYAAAALAGTSLEEAARLLDVLHGEGLLTETARRRYSMHDLIRRYARDAITPAEAGEAIERLYCRYWRAAGEEVARAGPCLTRHTRPGARPAPVPASPVGHQPATPGAQQRMAALNWFEAHRELLLACIDQAVERDLHHWVVRLTSVMAGFLRNNGPWDQGIDRHVAAARAAARLGDRIARGVALNDLGIMCRLAGRHEEALDALSQAHAIFADPFPVGIPERDVWLGQANALNEQAIVHNDRADHRAAMLSLEAALSLYHKADDRIGVANASKNLGVALYHVGADRDDTDLCKQALWRLSEATRGYAAIGDELGLAEVSNHKGRLRLHTRDAAGALADFSRALDMVDGTGNRLEAARAHEGIGECHFLDGDHDLARRHLEEARQRYTDIGAEAHSRDVDAKLVRLRPPPR